MKSLLRTLSPILMIGMVSVRSGADEHPQAAPMVTSLTTPEVRFTLAKEHHVVLKRGGIKSIVVDNSAIDVPALPGHRAGYSGLASLSHDRNPRNLFVPAYAGLNFEHIHDGTTAGLVEKFEPRKFPMELRLVNQHTVELYQPPTGNWKLESCGRFELLQDGTLEYTFECIPRTAGYRNNFIGLFWASYLNQPESKSIFFRGLPRGKKHKATWIEGITPSHGVQSTHGPRGGSPLPPIDGDFPLTLVNHPSGFLHTEPWYFGVSHGMAFVQMFRPRDQIWFAQSPTGGGSANPAWDFQWFIRNPEVGKAYGFVMRATYLPFESREQVQKDTQTHREALNAR